MSALKLAIVPVTPFQQNCSVIQCTATNQCVVIDPGGDLDRVEAAIEEMGGTLSAIWITHAHLDHAGATAELQRKSGVDVIGPHKEDQFWIDLLPMQASRFGFGHAEAFTPTRWLDQGDTVQVGEVEFQVFHCPGHTPGHVVFVQPEAKLAVVGDVLFKGSIGRTDFPRGNFEDLKSSIRDRLFPLGDDITFICGHGPTSTFGHERKTNPFVGDQAV
ncbi:MAG: MBL fold metallo-hydrolase [Bradymonadia bacterium]